MLKWHNDEYIASLSKTMHSKLRVTVAGPSTHEEPANGFPSAADDDMDVHYIS